MDATLWSRAAPGGALNVDVIGSALGAEFVDYYVHIKNAEIERFQAEVSDWEHREYFEMF